MKRISTCDLIEFINCGADVSNLISPLFIFIRTSASDFLYCINNSYKLNLNNLLLEPCSKATYLKFQSNISENIVYYGYVLNFLFYLFFIINDKNIIKNILNDEDFELLCNNEYITFKGSKYTFNKILFNHPYEILIINSYITYWTLNDTNTSTGRFFIGNISEFTQKLYDRLSPV